MEGGAAPGDVCDPLSSRLLARPDNRPVEKQEPAARSMAAK